MYSYRDAQMTRGLSRQGVGSSGPVPGCLLKRGISCGYNAGRSESIQHNDQAGRAPEMPLASRSLCKRS